MKEYLPYIVTFFCSVITALVSILIANRNSRAEIVNLEEKNKLEHIEYLQKSSFDIKKETILKTLKFLDTYISWLTFDEGRTPVREKTDKNELTFMARECYNNLCCTCNNSEILYAFNSVVFGNGDEIMSKYNNFRNAARIELGLEKVKLDDNNIFISIINTADINKIKE